jgi:hypothetical protein
MASADAHLFVVMSLFFVAITAPLLMKNAVSQARIEFVKDDDLAGRRARLR